MRKREQKCAYKYCLHKGEPVDSSDAVYVGSLCYHGDCYLIKTGITSCVNLYVGIMDDNSLAPAARKIITNLVFKKRVPIEFIERKLTQNGEYYKDKPVHVLYGLSTIFWGYEYPNRTQN